MMLGCAVLSLILIVLPAVIGNSGNNNSLGDDTVIKQLIGEPDYKSVKLHWITETPADISDNAHNDDEDDDEDGFLVRYCELQSWGAQRCKTRRVNEPHDNRIDDDSIKEVLLNGIDNDATAVPYTVNIDGLRMATTYTFEIRRSRSRKRTMRRNGTRMNRAESDDIKENVIVVPTKGFSARATQCLPHASEIEVSTGPHFGGRIAVESTDGERCAIDGDAESPRDTYTLRIDHAECGSRVNATTVATFVLVQENLPILTHSTRRFLVLCSYQPETLTVRAGINLPTTKSSGSYVPYNDGDAEEDAEETAGSRRGRKLREHRHQGLLQRAEALVTESKEDGSKGIHKGNPAPIIAATFVVMIGIVVVVLLMVRWNLKRLKREMDDVSIVSNGTDYTTSIDDINYGGSEVTAKAPRQEVV